MVVQTTANKGDMKARIHTMGSSCASEFILSSGTCQLSCHEYLGFFLGEPPNDLRREWWGHADAATWARKSATPLLGSGPRLAYQLNCFLTALRIFGPENARAAR